MFTISKQMDISNCFFAFVTGFECWIVSKGSCFGNTEHRMKVPCGKAYTPPAGWRQACCDGWRTVSIWAVWKQFYNLEHRGHAPGRLLTRWDVVMVDSLSPFEKLWSFNRATQGPAPDFVNLVSLCKRRPGDVWVLHPRLAGGLLTTAGRKRGSLEPVFAYCVCSLLKPWSLPLCMPPYFEVSWLLTEIFTKWELPKNFLP